MKKRIVTGITMGEPAGISYEITLKVWKNHRKKIEPFIFFGDPDHLLNTCTKLKFKVPIKIINEISECFEIFKNYLPVYKIKLNQKAKFGTPSIKNIDKILNSVDEVIKFASRRKISSVVTNPIEKNIIKKKEKVLRKFTKYSWLR